MMNLTNHFLVAMPSFNHGDIFSGSVVCITEHNGSNGAVGVIINKPVGRTLINAFHGVDLAKYNPNWLKRPLYLGGPINSSHGFVLHYKFNDGKLFELTDNKNILTQIANGNNKDQLFVSVGYAAWQQFQVESEIIHNEWLVVKADAGLIFDVDPINRYDEALKLLGINNISQLYCSGDVFA
ncbi:MAG TPA: YqgE/AlgH family protein [Burkholderiales bacterium]|nr:YqgE/AlgH family protein [Burkholderiales bacterium]